jgi:hypothetical protein
MSKRPSSSAQEDLRELNTQFSAPVKRYPVRNYNLSDSDDDPNFPSPESSLTDHSDDEIDAFFVTGIIASNQGYPQFQVYNAKTKKKHILNHNYFGRNKQFLKCNDKLLKNCKFSASIIPKKRIDRRIPAIMR